MPHPQVVVRMARVTAERGDVEATTGLVSQLLQHVDNITDYLQRFETADSETIATGRAR